MADNSLELRIVEDRRAAVLLVDKTVLLEVLPMYPDCFRIKAE
jgi:hypothetical protein